MLVEEAKGENKISALNLREQLKGTQVGEEQWDLKYNGT